MRSFTSPELLAAMAVMAVAAAVAVVLTSQIPPAVEAPAPPPPEAPRSPRRPSLQESSRAAPVRTSSELQLLGTLGSQRPEGSARLGEELGGAEVISIARAEVIVGQRLTQTYVE